MIKTLNATCDDMRAQVVNAGKERVPILEEAATLMAQNEDVKTKQKVLEAFKKRFLMSPDDVLSLTSSTKPVDDHFFELLRQAKRIHQDCEILLGTENQKLGLDLMDQTSRNLNNAFKKLYDWVQKEFRMLDLEDPHMSTSIRRALRVIAERPSLFQGCLDFFAEAREHTLSEAFHSALTATAGGAEVRKGSMKPIEFSTHDLLRYIGDMLAWIHSATVSEQESLEGLFISEGDDLAKGLKAGEKNVSWATTQATQSTSPKDTPFDGRKALNDLVNRNLAGAFRTLRQRSDLAIRNHDDPVLVYKTKNLFDFYEKTFSKLVGKDAALVSATSELIILAFDHFDHLMADEVKQAAYESIPGDFSAPIFLLNALDRFSLVLKAESAITHPPSSSTTLSTSRLLNSALIPFINKSSDIAAALPDRGLGSPSAKAVFQLNCLLPIQSRLNPYAETMSEFMTSINTTISSLISTLTTTQYVFFLQSSHVATLLSAIESSSADQSISELPAFTPEALIASAQKLDDFLPEAVLDGMKNLNGLADKKLAKQVTDEAAERFCADFEVVENKLLEADEMAESQKGGRAEYQEESGPESLVLRNLYPRTAREVRVLLS